jgi:hypothetical protein
VIRVLIDRNVVLVPVPVVAVGRIVWRYSEVVPVKPEASRTAAVEMPYMPATKPAIEAAMFPHVFHPVVIIVAASIVTHPAVPIHMRIVRVTVVVAEVTVFIVLVGIAVILLRPVPRGSAVGISMIPISMIPVSMIVMLGKSRQ